MGDTKALKSILASYSLKEKLSQTDLDMIDIEDALALVSGSETKKV